MLLGGQSLFPHSLILNGDGPGAVNGDLGLAPLAGRVELVLLGKADTRVVQDPLRAVAERVRLDCLSVHKDAHLANVIRRKPGAHHHHGSQREADAAFLVALPERCPPVLQIQMVLLQVHSFFQCLRLPTHRTPPSNTLDAIAQCCISG